MARPGPLLLLLLSCLASAQESEVIKVETSLVQLPVVVRDKKDRPLENLGRENFRVTYAGKDHPLSFFGAEKAALALEIVVDVSGSLKGRRGDIASATEKLLGKLDASRGDLALVDVISSGCFRDYGPRWKAPSSELAASVRAQLKDCQSSQSPVLVSVRAAAWDFRQLPKDGLKRKRAVVVISDFADTDSSYFFLGDYEGEKVHAYGREAYLRDLARAKDDYLSEGASLFAVLPDGGHLDKYSRALGADVGAAVAQAAEATGGRARKGSLSNLGGLYDDILKDLRGLYLLGFELDGAFEPSKAAVEYVGGVSTPSPDKVVLRRLK